MKISLNWLQDFITLKEKDPEVIKARLTAAVAEVETMETQGAHLKEVVVAEITEVSPHPNADMLRLVNVNDGAGTVKIVCGGSNLAPGMKVALAKIGAVVQWHGGETMQIKPTRIRGEESFGMICAAEEIGLGEMFAKKAEKEIVDLSHIKAAPGTPLAEALGLNDTVIHVDNHAITHRADLFSEIGFAREFVAASLAVWKKRKDAPSLPKHRSPAPVSLKITNADLCPRYVGVYITGLSATPSPSWMQQRLEACGVRPLNVMVDVTNYVMLELGMPLHAFDLERVEGRAWTLRQSKAGEKVVTLDEKEHELPAGMIVLDDGKSIFDLCGIMGGVTSGITEKTTKVWLHAPVYNATLIRRAMRTLNHVSDAGIIYEKGVDPALAEKGLARAVELLLELCPGAKVASETVEMGKGPAKARSITLKQANLENLIGLKITSSEIKKTLQVLGFECKKAKNGLGVGVPGWRGDVEGEADLIEEIARLHGYDKIPEIAPEVTMESPVELPRRKLERWLKERCAERGYDEILTFAFTGPALIQKTGQAPGHETIALQNPISEEMSLLRESLLPRTLETIEQNLRYQQNCNLFELSRVYRKEDDEAKEKSMLLIAATGDAFRRVQGDIESLDLTSQPLQKASPAMHPGRRATLIKNNVEVGTLYEVHPSVLKAFDLKTRVTVAELDVTKCLEAGLLGTPKYQELPRFPGIRMDVSLLIPKKDLASSYRETIQKSGTPCLSDVAIIDEYAGTELGHEKRSITLSLTYQSPEKTLTDDEVKPLHQKVLSLLTSSGASIRE